MALGSIRSTAAAFMADRTSRLIAATSLSLIAGLALLCGYLCADLHASAWRKAERDSENIAALIGHTISRTVQSYDLSLRETARVAAMPEIAGLDPSIARLALFDTAARTLGVGRVVITDAQGRVLISSAPAGSPLPDYADLPDLRIHAAEPSGGLILSGPHRSRLSGKPILRLTRRITGDDGRFRGLAIGAVPVDDIQAGLDRVLQEEGSSIFVVHRDGTIIFSSPYVARFVGLSLVDGEAYRRDTTQAGGRYVGPGKIDGRERLFVFADLDGLPLTVSVAVATDSIRAAWIYRAATLVALVLAVSVLIFGLAILLQRELAHRAAREASSRKDNAALVLLARTDGLTGLPNRRGYDEALAFAWQRAARLAEPLSLLIVDADHFKQFNDRFGHHRGDEVLRSIAECVRQTLKPSGGIACRVGGEEFAAILPGIDGEPARIAAERVRRAVVGLQIAHAIEVGGIATVSIGLASAKPGDGTLSEALFAAADAALYEAKSAGRNRVRAVLDTESVPLARSA